MARVRILGPRRLLPDAVRFLQGQGVVQLRTPRTGPRAGRRAGPGAGRGAALALVRAHPDDAGEERALEEAIRRIDDLLARRPGAGPAPGPAPSLPDVRDPAFVAALDVGEAALARLDDRRRALVEERRAVGRLARLLGALVPLRAAPSDVPGGRVFALALRRDRAEALEVLEREVDRITDGLYAIAARDVDRHEMAVLVTVPPVCGAAVAGLLFEQGVEEVRLPDRYAGEGLGRAPLALLARDAEIPGEIERLDREQAAEAARWRPALVAARREARNRLARVTALGSAGMTGHAFLVTGWAPRRAVAQLGNAARATFGGRVDVSASEVAPGEEDEVPVVLDNPPALRPFELLLTLVPLPRYGSVDPTPWLAVFFPLLFGMALGDVAFGALGLAAAGLAVLRRWGGDPGRKVAVVVAACSASALVFGVLFGEALGSLGRHLGMRPLLFDRGRAVLPFLGLTLAVGVVHVGVGLALGVRDAARAGEWRHGVDRAARLGALAAGAALALRALGVLPPGAGPWAAGLLLLCFAAGLAARGPMAALEWVLGVGNVLSYARLMALGLASTLLCDVANDLAETVRPAAAGIALAAFLHAMNFTLCALSPAVAALRLQYVEFFDKFYREGGAPFRPLALSTK
jgi:V/A-type H+-transporting ATPase subunit I